MKIYAYEIDTNRRTNHKKFDFFNSYEKTNEKMEPTPQEILQRYRNLT